MRNTATKLWRVWQDLLFFARRRQLFSPETWQLIPVSRLLYHKIEYTIFAYPLAAPLPSYTPRLPIVYRAATPADAACFRQIQSPSQVAYTLQRLNHGRNCFMALHEDKLIAFAWATDEISFNLDNLEMRLSPGDVYIDDVYTAPDYRRLGIQYPMHIEQLRYLQNHKSGKFKRAIVIADVNNAPSQKMIRKFGYQEIDRLVFKRVFLKRTFRYQNGLF